MKQLDEKLSSAAKVAIGALIYQQVKKMKQNINLANKKADLANSEIEKKEKEINDLQKRLQTVASAGEDLGKAIINRPSGGFEKSQLDQIRKMIRKEVGRILFDIYKLRNAWANRS
jgi:chromosome segregation ATPase